MSRCLRTARAVLAMGLVWLAAAPGEVRADRPLAPMTPDRAVQCHEDRDGNRWRVQCDDTTRLCLYAPDAELDADGERRKPLDRAAFCALGQEPFEADTFQRRGYRLERGLADAPHGWMRDHRGRVFQVDFDLNKRMYVGAGYAPRLRTSDGDKSSTRETKRTALDFGLLVFEHYRPRHRTRHRLRIMEGEVFLAPFEADVTAVRYDLSHRFDDPLLRLTTFFGTPRRFDLHLNVGVWVEAGGLEIHTDGERDDKLWRIGTVHGTLDLLQSRQQASFLRVRAGLGFEIAKSGGVARDALTPGAAIEGVLALGSRGFHLLGMTLEHERPLYGQSDSLAGSSVQRTKARAEYEVIVLALNDQPLSLHLGVTTERRNDSPILPQTWSARADAGLRFSLWAPPRRP